MKRALAVSISFAVVLSIGYSASLTRSGVAGTLDSNLGSTHYEARPVGAEYAPYESGARPGYLQTSRKTESKITIVFAGLIYLRHKGGPTKKGPFTACILKNIPGHTFRLLGDIILKECPMKKNWDLNVIKDSSGTPKEGAQPRVIAGFDRKKKDHPCDDYQWIVDFNQLYPGGYRVDDDGLGPVVKIRTGEFYTLCRTVRLSHKKGDEDKWEFGFMADITGVDIMLEPGERLVLRSGLCDIIDPLDYREGTRYIVFANLPPSDMFPDHDMGHRKIGERQSGPPTHFLDYYFVIPKSYGDRYDFDLMEMSETCPLPQELKDLLERKVTRSPPPYYCGVGGGTG